MILRKVIFTLVGSLCLLSYQTTIAASTPIGVRAHAAEEELIESGVINNIDPARSQIVISDIVFGYSAVLIKVHRNGRISGMTSLRPNQEIRYRRGVRMPGTSLGAPGTVMEIWVDKD